MTLQQELELCFERLLLMAGLDKDKAELVSKRLERVVREAVDESDAGSD